MSAAPPLDTYRYDQPVSKVSRLLWWCAGADEQLLQRCPFSDRVKFQGLGGIVFATGFLAFLSGSYAFYTVFSPKVGTALEPLQKATHWPSAALSVGFGLIWALIIFNLDRFIVASTGKGDGTDRITLGELGRALPRIAMAFIIGVCLSAPLEIRILESEIESELQNVQRHEFDKRRLVVEKDRRKQEDAIAADIAKAGREIDESRARVAESKKLVDSMRRGVEAEVDGASGSGKKGAGPAFKVKNENFELAKQTQEIEKQKEAGVEAKALETLTTLKRDSQNQLANEAKEDEQIAQEVRHKDGLMQRIKISHDIGGAVPWAIMALLLCIELGPVFFKMMLIKGAYDYLDENQKKVASARAGIGPDTHLVAGKDGTATSYRIDVFYGPDALIERERLSLETSSQLTRQVHEKFRKITAEDIEKNPNKYLEQDPK